MDSRPLTVQQICQDRRQYRVPFYQRPVDLRLELTHF